ncbi:mechanosensitive ion channel domain-containing protein [Moorena bouillonii]|uniref:Cyclic nucleotide-binding domain-containing protein n=2 Tax=Moorena TaxID=1155738 RepID=A0A1U7N1K6_9CYAN|nr:mechanosensitive ion channel domain-containing protein [Moorena bouillonii]OLT59837.1 hypothetical protein BJP37_13200 [Moorena bouillonii PNG]
MTWIITQIQKLGNAISKVFTAKLFEFGGQAFSLSFLGKFLFLCIIAILISRTIKALIKHWLLSRFRMDRGTREALASIIGYILSILGFLIVLQTSGINLSSLAIFAGALGIGFGIGLQDLASNFISGLTILLDQPIKVGDYIEIDNLSGTVEKISIRSTVIRTIHNVCVIIPNNSFVQNNVINWSYENPTSRLQIPINFPDELDPLVITELLLAAARQEPRVLSSPSPQVWFKGYGEEGMDFELLVWIDKPAESQGIKSALYYLIDTELRSRHIEPGHPERNLRIHNPEALVSLFRQLQTPGVTNGSSSTHKQSATAKRKPKSKSAKAWKLADLLRQVSYFQNCSDIELRHIIEEGYRKTLPAYETICRENDPGDSFYIILSGKVEVFVESIGKRVATRKSGEFIGEMSLLMGTPRTATLRTLEETMLFVVDRDNLQSLLAKHEELADRISEELSKRQETLERLGITVSSTEEDETPFAEIRKRIQSIFGI